MLAPLAQLLRVARLTPTATPDLSPHAGTLPTPPPADRNDPTLDRDITAWRTNDPTRPRISILGPITAHLPGELTDSKRRLYIEILLYLLTRRTRTADREEIENSLWYGHPAGDGSVRAAISRIRKWLGPRHDHTEWITEGTNRGYHLADGVLLDWHLITRLRERGGHHGITDYRAALQLVRGTPLRIQPYRANYRRPYTWIDNSDIAPTRIIATITDIAHRAATHYLTIGNTELARWAIDQAWLADPDRGNDDLWHDRMKAEHLDGRTAALQQLVTELLETRGAEILEDLQSHTYNLIRTLLPTAALSPHRDRAESLAASTVMARSTTIQNTE